MSSHPLILIPSRLAAVRFPNKPLALIHGKPMVLHVWERAVKAGVGPVVVACGDQEIKDVIENAGGRAVMTNPDLASGSDRIYEALCQVDPQGRIDTVINLQGDLPTIEPEDIRKVLLPLENAKFDIATLVTPVKDESEITNRNVVKAIVGNIQDTIGQAFYFSRTGVASGDNIYYHHMGIYAYRREALKEMVDLPRSPLEKQESLEQLRALEAGMLFGVCITDAISLGVDTPEDLEKAAGLFL